MRLWFCRDATDGKFYTSIFYIQEEQIPVISGMGILRLRANTGNRILSKCICLTVVLAGSEFEPQVARNKQRSTHKYEPAKVAVLLCGLEMIGHPFW